MMHFWRKTKSPTSHQLTRLLGAELLMVRQRSVVSWTLHLFLLTATWILAISLSPTWVVMMILGMPWLVRLNPQVHWRDGTVKLCFAYQSYTLVGESHDPGIPTISALQFHKEMVEHQSPCFQCIVKPTENEESSRQQPAWGPSFG